MSAKRAARESRAVRDCYLPCKGSTHARTQTILLASDFVIEDEMYALQ